MKTQAEKTQPDTSKAIASSLPKQQNDAESASEFEDNRPEAMRLRNLQEMANNSPQAIPSQAIAGNHFDTISSKDNLLGMGNTIHTAAIVQRVNDPKDPPSEEEPDWKKNAFGPNSYLSWVEAWTMWFKDNYTGFKNSGKGKTFPRDEVGKWQPVIYTLNEILIHENTLDQLKERINSAIIAVGDVIAAINRSGTGE